MLNRLCSGATCRRSNVGTILNDCAFFFIYSRNAKKLLFSQNRTKKNTIKTIEK